MVIALYPVGNEKGNDENDSRTFALTWQHGVDSNT
jgi:hypothetical protein